MNVAMSTATAEYWKAEGNAANAEVRSENAVRERERERVALLCCKVCGGQGLVCVGTDLWGLLGTDQRGVGWYCSRHWLLGVVGTDLGWVGTDQGVGGATGLTNNEATHHGPAARAALFALGRKLLLYLDAHYGAVCAHDDDGRLKDY
eukprot:19866-Rhodomonas_salina.1